MSVAIPSLLLYALMAYRQGQHYSTFQALSVGLYIYMISSKSHTGSHDGGSGSSDFIIAVNFLADIRLLTLQDGVNTFKRCSN
jgi:hypothetical protein